MNAWKDNTARRIATTEFVKRLNANPDLRKLCKSDPVAAKAAFQTIGDFAEIPDEVQFFVLEADRASSENIVTLVLPDPADDPDKIDPVNIWKCSWPVYAS